MAVQSCCCLESVRNDGGGDGDGSALEVCGKTTEKFLCVCLRARSSAAELQLTAHCGALASSRENDYSRLNIPSAGASLCLLITAAVARSFSTLSVSVHHHYHPLHPLSIHPSIQLLAEL